MQLLLNAIDLEECKNSIVAHHAESRRLVENVLNVPFHGDVAVRNELIMRKEIVPLLKAALEGER